MEIKPSEEWIEIGEVFERKGGRLFVIGASDSGKTTFLLFILNFLIKKGKRVGMLDLDIGQSSIGPPTTVGFGIANKEVETLTEIKPEKLYFVGSVSPKGHLLQILIGAEKLIRESEKHRVDHLLVDTTGLVDGPVAEILKEGKIEIINPDTLKPLPDGETGELVITTLTKEAFPVIRYRTRDITSIISEPCPCGRTFKKISRIIGRTDDMLIVGGINFFPSQLESVMLGFEEITPHYEIHLGKKGRLDSVSVKVETKPDFWAGVSEDKIAALIRKVEDKVKDLLGFRMDVRIVEPQSIPRSEGKAQRVVDDR